MAYSLNLGFFGQGHGVSAMSDNMRYILRPDALEFVVGRHIPHGREEAAGVDDLDDQGGWHQAVRCSG